MQLRTKRNASESMATLSSSSSSSKISEYESRVWNWLRNLRNTAQANWRMALIDGVFQCWASGRITAWWTLLTKSKSRNTGKLASEINKMRNQSLTIYNNQKGRIAWNLRLQKLTPRERNWSSPHPWHTHPEGGRWQRNGEGGMKHGFSPSIGMSSSTKASYPEVHQLLSNDITTFNVVWSKEPSDVLGMESLRKSIMAIVSLFANGDWHAQQNRQSARALRCSVINSVSCFLCFASPIDLHFSSLPSSPCKSISRSFCSIFAINPADSNGST